MPPTGSGGVESVAVVERSVPVSMSLIARRADSSDCRRHDRRNA
jgi:hypothetical protein